MPVTLAAVRGPSGGATWNLFFLLGLCVCGGCLFKLSGCSLGDAGAIFIPHEVKLSEAGKDDASNQRDREKQS